MTYSYDSWHIQRTLRDPIVPNAEMGEFGTGVMRLMSLLVDDDKSIRIYSCALKLEHGHHVWADDPGAMLLHRLQLDRFIYLQSDGGPVNWALDHCS